MIPDILRDLPPVAPWSRRFWGGALGLLRWKLAQRRGRRALATMLEQGMAPWLREPLAFLLGKPLEPVDALVRSRIEELRRGLLRRGDEEVEAWVTRADRPGAPRWEPARDVTPRRVSLRYVAAVGSIVPYWGTFLFLCAKSLQARAILELGACAGISSCYLAADPASTWFATIEGSPQLSRLAESHLAQVSSHARVFNLAFDDALDAIVPALPGPLDMVFIDGEHTRRALLRYFERIVPHLREGGVAIFDDIHWSQDLEEAWQILARSRGIACSVNLGRLGLCVRGAPESEPRVFDFSRFTAFWRRGGPPRPG